MFSISIIYDTTISQDLDEEPVIPSFLVGGPQPREAPTYASTSSAHMPTVTVTVTERVAALEAVVEELRTAVAALRLEAEAVPGAHMHRPDLS